MDGISEGYLELLRAILRPMSEEARLKWVQSRLPSVSGLVTVGSGTLAPYSRKSRAGFRQPWSKGEDM